MQNKSNKTVKTKKFTVIVETSDRLEENIVDATNVNAKDAINAVLKATGIKDINDIELNTISNTVSSFRSEECTGYVISR